MSPTPRKPLQNIVWLLGERVGRALVTVTVLGIVARHLEPAGFGRLNFAIAIVLIGMPLANLGLEGLVVNELVRRPGQAGAVLGTAFRLRLAAGVGTALLLTLAGLAAAPHDAALIGIVALGLLFQPAEVVDLWFQRQLDSRRTVVARTVAIFAGATLRLWLAAADAPLAAFAWAQAADMALIAGALAWSGRRSPHASGPWTWDRDIARLFWTKGAPLALSGAVVALALRMDQLVVRAWLGESAAGVYFAATRLIDLVVFAGSATLLSLFPALAASHQESAAAFHDRLQRQFDALSALGWAAFLGCLVAGPWVIRLLYGPAYAGAAPILAVLGGAGLVMLNAGVRWNYILLAASPLLSLAAAGLHVATLAGLCMLLVPRLGPIGAAIGMLASCVVSGLLTTFLFPSLRPCAGPQSRGLLILFTPGRWRDLLRQFHE